MAATGAGGKGVCYWFLSCTFFSTTKAQHLNVTHSQIRKSPHATQHLKVHEEQHSSRYKHPGQALQNKEHTTQ